MLVGGHGRIVAEYFDVGQSRVLPWACRPQAAALLAAMADPGRGFDAVVIGEYERAFYGSQYSLMAPLFEHYGIQLWTPEACGRVDFQAEGHDVAMIALGIQSKREIARTRIRVLTAMAAQTREQGRFLGGRPPYGYQLADAGPHPNRAHAAWGRRARRLDPDPVTAPIVSWMFAERLAGHSMAWITRALNDAAVPCPSAADPQRNQHRSGQAWTLGAVRAILANPRYTGRQVWNRQRTDHDLISPANTALGHRQVHRWNLPEGWVISARPFHSRWSANRTTSPCRAGTPRRPKPGSHAGTCWLGCCAAGLPATARVMLGEQPRRLSMPPQPLQLHPPDPGRPRNLCLRADHILARLPALLILLADTAGTRVQATSVCSPADIPGHLRARGITLTYDPQNRTLRADGIDAATVTISRSS